MKKVQSLLLKFWQSWRIWCLARSRKFHNDATDDAIAVSHTDLLAKYAPDDSTRLWSQPWGEVINSLLAVSVNVSPSYRLGSGDPFYLPQRIGGRSHRHVLHFITAIDAVKVFYQWRET